MIVTPRAQARRTPRATRLPCIFATQRLAARQHSSAAPSPLLLAFPSLISSVVTPGSAFLPMDAAQSVAQQLTEAESWGGQTRPHQVAEVLSQLLPLLPLDRLLL